MKLTQKTINDLAYKIVGRAIEVHNELGPGLLESVYKKCLCYELKQNNIAFKNQVEIAIKYKQTQPPKGLLINFNTKNISKDLIPLVTQNFSKLPIK